jgi:hypothetical protein
MTNPDYEAFSSDCTRGLTKREYMAIHFIAAMLANSALTHEPSLHSALCSLDAVFSLTKELNRESQSCK